MCPTCFCSLIKTRLFPWRAKNLMETVFELSLEIILWQNTLKRQKHSYEMIEISKIAASLILFLLDPHHWNNFDEEKFNSPQGQFSCNRGSIWQFLQVQCQVCNIDWNGGVARPPPDRPRPRPPPDGQECRISLDPVAQPDRQTWSPDWG